MRQQSRTNGHRTVMAGVQEPHVRGCGCGCGLVIKDSLLGSGCEGVVCLSSAQPCLRSERGKGRSVGGGWMWEWGGGDEGMGREVDEGVGRGWMGEWGGWGVGRGEERGEMWEW